MRSETLRKAVQTIWGVVSNGYVAGWLPGPPAIYQGPLKRLCVPGMNCYSCPGALGSCPIGSLQSILDGRTRRFPAYVLGFLAAVGLFVGRLICGWLCLFGLIQELLYMIPTPKLQVPERVDRPLRYLKYVMLAVFVIALPCLYRSEFGIGEPFFCEYVCPVGTLEGGIPLVLLDETMRGALGWLFRWKFALMVLCLVSSVFIYRPFCKYVCPLGAFYSLFQKVSLVRMRVHTTTCVGCGTCARTCKMGVDPTRDANSAECIRCGACVSACPVRAISIGIAPKVAPDASTKAVTHPKA